MKNIGILIFIGMFLSCSLDDSVHQETLEMRINHYQNTGIGEGLYLTLMVQEGNDIGSDNWYKFYNRIERFNYQPGYVYDIRVLVKQVENPPADGSSLQYILKEIISTQEVDLETPFDIDLKIDGQSFITTTSGYELLNQIKIDCNLLCDELEIKLQNQNYISGTFKRLETNKIKLVALE